MARRVPPFYYRLAAVLLLALAVILPFAPRLMRQATANDPPFEGPKPFASWPQDQKPEVVLVLTGQTFGYLSPCGCSRPQKGGLERRANFLDELRAKGWPVVGLDLGDIATDKPKVAAQDLLKYKAAMQALNAMGYAAVGLGEQDFSLELDKLIGEYSLQQKDPRPVLLTANLAGKGGVPRDQFIPAGQNGRVLVEDVEIVTKDSTGAACLPFGVTAVVGRSVGEKVVKFDGKLEFLDNGPVLKAALAKIAANEAKPAINVLLYSGTHEDAKKLAEAHPAFNLILCQIEESEPPQFPTMLNGGKTMLVQVGHKGQNVGVVGVFKNASGGYELQYQLVPLGEQYLTPPNLAGKNKVLPILEKYTDDIRKKNLLAQFTANPLEHPATIQLLFKNPKASPLTYVGTDKCITCHPQEGAVWKAAKHSQAYTALVNAKNPGNRQFDGDCVACHTTGFGYKTGFTDVKATPNLLHNGCENCHGPGSGHAADPKDKALLALMTPWRQESTDRLPPKSTMEILAKVKPGELAPIGMQPREQLTWNAVSAMCMKCHDGENDPKFDLNRYMPQIWHSGLKAAAGAGLPANAK